MASRLDRLVVLLETGSTTLVRTTAAQQLADVQRQHPHELYNLLARVAPYLRNREWECRVAAGEANGGGGVVGAPRGTQNPDYHVQKTGAEVSYPKRPPPLD